MLLSETDEQARAARTQTAPVAHGGDLGCARALFPHAPEPWLDLSTGINPVPYPCPAFEASTIRRLPSAADLLALKHAAARAYGVPGADHVAAAPGTQILIETLPRLWPRSRVAVVGPTYAEHAAAWSRAGHDVEAVSEATAETDADILVVVSPNNPDGRVLPLAVAEELAARQARHGGLVVIDQAFADLEGDAARPARSLAGIVALRSFGKSYGLAGIRLGFALAEPAWARRLEAALGAWAVSGPAIVAGTAALSDAEWRRDAAAARARDAARLDRMLLRAGGQIVGGTVLFRTAAFANAGQLFRWLGEAGIYVRRFTDAPTWLRFGLPGTKTEWCRLSRVLKGKQS